MDVFLQFVAGAGLVLCGFYFGYGKGFLRGALYGYKHGAREMEEALFGELEKLRKDGII